MSPSSSVIGEYGFELFYASGRPEKWRKISIKSDGATDTKGGAYELRYTYLPEHRTISGVPTVFHGVRQQVIDLQTNDVIAERVNYLWGKDFNRSTYCLGADWYDGNNSFAERVLGKKYDDSIQSYKYERKPELYLKAKLNTVDDVKISLHNKIDSDALPIGSVYDYNNREIRLPDGKFKMLGYGNGEPVPIISTIKQENGYVFVMLPHGFLRNRPAREVMFDYRSFSGEEIRKVFVQIPRGVDWTNGWGIDEQDIQVSDTNISFKLYGAKHRAEKYSDQNNEGTYSKRYTFSVNLLGHNE